MASFKLQGLAVEVLLNYGASKEVEINAPDKGIVGNHNGYTAYDLTLRSFLKAILEQRKENVRLSGPFRAQYRMYEHRPLETDNERLKLQKLEDATRILELLSNPDGSPISSLTKYDPSRKEVCVAPDAWDMGVGIKMRRIEEFTKEQLDVFLQEATNRGSGLKILYRMNVGNWTVDLDFGTYLPDKLETNSVETFNFNLDAL